MICSPDRLTLDAVREALTRIGGYINRTPVMTSSTLDARANTSLHFKCENFQKAGVFKARGAANAVLALSDREAAAGVVTHSSGNHGAALAWAARLRRIPARIVMPHSAPKAKIAAVQRYGGTIVFCEPPADERERVADEVCAASGATLIHPYDDLRVMAGQGTSALELLESVPDLDAIVCPVGGGGQISGVAVAAKALKPTIRIVGVEPVTADDAARSFKVGRILPYDGGVTIADGLRTSLGQRTFMEIRDYVDAMRASLAAALGLDPGRVSVKGKTNEGVDAVGRGEAIAAHAIALLRSR